MLSGEAVGIAQSYNQSDGTVTHVLNNVVRVPGDGWIRNGNSIQVSGDNSTVIGNELEVTGYHSNTLPTDDSTTGIMVVDASNVEVKHNYINYVDEGAGEQYRGIKVLGYSSGVNADNNLIAYNTVIGSESGISLEAKDSHVRDTIVSYNDIEGNNVGILVFERGLSYRNTSSTVAKWNNITGNEIGIDAEDHDGWFNAKHNWWGDYTPSEHVEGDVNTSDYLGGPHNGFVNGEDYNENGFADLNDLFGVTHSSYDNNPIVVENPGLETNGGNQKALNLEVQMDGPTSTNDHQDGTVGIDMEVTMGQGPVQ